MLASLVFGLLPRFRPIMIPLGPKIFAALSMLLALRLLPQICIWRTSAGSGEDVANRHAGGTVVAFDYELPEFPAIRRSVGSGTPADAAMPRPLTRVRGNSATFVGAGDAQMWVNLPAAEKMAEPRHQDLARWRLAVAVIRPCAARMIAKYRGTLASVKVCATARCRRVHDSLRVDRPGFADRRRYFRHGRHSQIGRLRQAFVRHGCFGIASRRSCSR